MDTLTNQLQHMNMAQDKLPPEFEIYDLLREDVPSILFYFSRESDNSICIYEANRKENELIGDCVNIYTSTLGELKGKKPLSGWFVRRFCEMKVTQDENKAYWGRLAGFPARLLRLRLKKLGNRVTATTTMHVNWQGHIIDVQDCEFYNVRLKFDNPYKPSRILMFGRATKENILAGLKNAKVNLVPKWGKDDKEMIHLVENIPVTDDMEISKEDYDKEN